MGVVLAPQGHILHGELSAQGVPRSLLGSGQDSNLHVLASPINPVRLSLRRFRSTTHEATCWVGRSVAASTIPPPEPCLLQRPAYELHYAMCASGLSGTLFAGPTTVPCSVLKQGGLTSAAFACAYSR